MNECAVGTLFIEEPSGERIRLGDATYLELQNPDGSRLTIAPICLLSERPQKSRRGEGVMATVTALLVILAGCAEIWLRVLEPKKRVVALRTTLNDPKRPVMDYDEPMTIQPSLPQGWVLVETTTGVRKEHRL